MQSQKLHFPNSDGQQLAARLDLPLSGAPLAFALFAHCFTCNKNLKAVDNINRALTREGFAVLRFDFTGLGESDGEFADTNFSSNVADLIAAAHFLENHYRTPSLLLGHSLGGAAVLQAAAALPEVKALVTIGSPAEPRHVTRLLRDSRATIERAGQAEVVLAGRTFTIKKQFLDDLAQRNMATTIRKLNRALLIFHSPVDTIVGIDNAAQIFQAAMHPKSFVSLDHADHLLSDAADSQYVGTVAAAWARKYLDGARKTHNEAMPADNAVHVQTGSHGYLTEIAAGHHSLVADEPPAVGGTNLGPTPYDYLLAALGACTSMTLRMYADRKAWPLEAVGVHLNHQKVHARDCRECESEQGYIDHIERLLELAGPLDDAQKQRLLQIADRCPVHRTLHGEIVVKTDLVP